MLMQADGGKAEEREPENTSRMETLFHRFLESVARRRIKKLSFSEYADELRFPNASFFGKYVREHLGMSPNEYRRKLMDVSVGDV